MSFYLAMRRAFLFFLLNPIFNQDRISRFSLTYEYISRCAHADFSGNPGGLNSEHLILIGQKVSNAIGYLCTRCVMNQRNRTFRNVAPQKLV